MRDAIETYLENVLCYADLAPTDERSVRAELAEHIQALAVDSCLSNPKELYAMLKDQFGNPKTVGRAIAAAKGRVHTYFKKARRRWPIQMAVCLILVFAVRYSVAQVFYVAGDGVSPQVPKGSRVLVYKLSNTFTPGDVIVYRYSSTEYRMGIVDSHTNDDQWLVEKHRGPQTETTTLKRDQIVGKVLLNTR